ncbi:MAG: MerC domain-containing protein [Planctomycetota bacterium]
MKKTGPWTDWLGVTASIACAIHCAAMPFVIAFLPMLGLSFLADEGFHQVMVGVCLAIAAIAFVPGWRMHRRLLPTGIAAAGLALIATAAFALEGECCPSCATAAAPTAETSSIAATTVSVTQVDAAAEEVVCDDETCEHCAKTAQADAVATTDQAEIESSETATLLSIPLISWITPLGGLLLVSAHLTNRRFMCRSSECCPSDEQAA